MRRIILLMALAIVGTISFGQNTKGLKPLSNGDAASSGTTRAVIVGISDYQNDNITDLEYAHKDAQVFADFLMDANGYGVDSNNVTVLLNSDATSGKFVAALYGLIEDSKEGDDIIIYFSGHGDVESSTISQPGFLLCWDAPSKVYMGGGTFGLAYLQEIISTLSLKSKAKVLVITDACRSGKLAGNTINGAQATAANLSQQYANEVKIMSCQPDEYALEGVSWGGGRGVFSYYLMAGLKGLADRNGNGEVTLTEIERYLEDQVSESVDPHSQIPLTVGQRNTVISKVNPSVLEQTKQELADGTFGVVAEKGMLNLVNSIKDTTAQQQYALFNEALEADQLLYPEDSCAWHYYHLLKDHPELKHAEGLMRRNLAAALQDKAQQAINRYLESSNDELNRRWAFDSTYYQYPRQLEKATELLGPDHFFYKTLKARKFYFMGLNKRLEAERSDLHSDYGAALSLQDSSLYYEPHAAYTLNEKGYTYFLLNKNKEAKGFLENALKYTPEWALAWSNLCGTEIRLKEFDAAIISGKKSIRIDSSLAIGYFNLGLTYEKMDSLDKGIEHYKIGLELSPRSALLNNKFGLLAFNKKNYDSAEKYMLLAHESNPFSAQYLINLGHVYLKQGNFENSKAYFLKAKDVRPNSQKSYQGLIEFYFYTNDMASANKELQSYVIEYPEDNYSHYLIASIEASFGNIDKSLTFIEKALEKGFSKKSILENDENLKEVIKTERYAELIKAYLSK